MESLLSNGRRKCDWHAPAPIDERDDDAGRRRDKFSTCPARGARHGGIETIFNRLQVDLLTNLKLPWIAAVTGGRDGLASSSILTQKPASSWILTNPYNHNAIYWGRRQLIVN